MANTAASENVPPTLRKAADGGLDICSLADLLEWFLSYDSRVGLVRHPHVNELFHWKQADEAAHGAEIYPFENAETRFAVGVFQALGENNSESKLARWVTDVLQALGESKQMREDLAESYKLNAENSPIAEAEKIPNGGERRLFLTSGWLEALCTAEVRFLGWVYQEIYDKPFQPVIEQEQ